MSDRKKMSLQVPESVLPGVYANQLLVQHTREEFLLDFINRFPPRRIVAARIIVSPGHLKRMIGALTNTLKHYEASHGTIDLSAPAPPQPEIARPDTATGPPPVQKQNTAAAVPATVLAGVYANQMVISHTREEFLFDFINVFPPQSVVTSRVFVSPEMARRMIDALRQNFRRHEAAHGTIPEAMLPQPDSYIN